MVMDSIRIPSPTAFLNTSPSKPNHSSSGHGSSSKRPTSGKRASYGESTVKASGATKPKQSKSRNGCVTCKAKRLKCDETKPTCQQCHKRNVECGGYKKDFKWRSFEESNFVQKANAPAKARKTPSALSVNKSSKITNDRGLISPALSDVSSAASPFDQASETSFLDQPPLPPSAGISPHTTYLTPNEMFNRADSSPYMLPPDHQKMPPRSHPTPTSNPPQTKFSDRSPKIADLLLPVSNTPNQFMGFQPDSGLDDEMDFEMKHNDAEEVGRHLTVDNNTANWVMRLPSPSPSSSSGSSSESQVDRSEHQSVMFMAPQLDVGSPEMLMMRYNHQTCGILSVKDGPNENPWRTLIWPLIHESPALFHAIASMTAFHTAKDIPSLRLQGIQHMKKSIKALRNNLGEMRTDAALATTLILAFSESWDVHISTGIEHLKGAKILVNQALTKHRASNLDNETVSRLRFLINTWIYMDVIARLTSMDEDDSNDFDNDLDSAAGPFDACPEVDPLMGCASSLFPLIGRVANLVRKVRRSSTNSPSIIARAAELKILIEEWEVGTSWEAPEDQSSIITHSIQTAEAYRWATLLYLHQAVPEIPSITSTELARKVMVYLATVPLTSRAIIVHIYPLLAAGCEASSLDDRKWIDDRWAAMTARMWIGNIDRCRDVVREVWDRRDKLELERTRALTPALSIMSDEPAQQDCMIRKLSADSPSTSDSFGWSETASVLARRRATDSSLSSRNLNVPPMIRRKSSENYADDTMDFEISVRGSAHWVGVMRDWKWEGEIL
ncbi:MAG: hypothetical protein M1814_003728 [Vezdaea aestivalis]|nr:MAG: hypothetical protein M1814_003728 [Vezdaea aestivalis]